MPPIHALVSNIHRRLVPLLVCSMLTCGVVMTLLHMPRLNSLLFRLQRSTRRRPPASSAAVSQMHIVNMSMVPSGSCGSTRACQYHRRFPSVCAPNAVQPHHVPVVTPTVPLVAPATTPEGSHSTYFTSAQSLYETQSCQYELLAFWGVLSSTLNISRWSLASGSLVGLACYQGMVPWDDDVDVRVHLQDCAALEVLWDTLHDDAGALHEDFGFASRQLSTRYDLLRAHAWFSGFRGTCWKLAVREPRVSPRGMDIKCTYPLEWQAFELRSFADVFEDVDFGPVKARRIRPAVLSAWHSWGFNPWGASLQYWARALYASMGLVSSRGQAPIALCW